METENIITHQCLGKRIKITKDEIHLMSEKLGHLIKNMGMFTLLSVGSYLVAKDNPDKPRAYGANTDCKSMIKGNRLKKC